MFLLCPLILTKKCKTAKKKKSCLLAGQNNNKKKLFPLK